MTQPSFGFQPMSVEDAIEFRSNSSFHVPAAPKHRVMQRVLTSVISVALVAAALAIVWLEIKIVAGR